MDLELDGRRALSPARKRGIGKAIAERLAGEGCALAIGARDGAKVERADDDFRERGVTVEVADVACFLLSARASWISGTNVVVDGAQNQPGMAGW
jgi:NAD(P)-dependent dehydrogenase (short-subunit alcohol dehydrogenase family)